MAELVLSLPEAIENINRFDLEARGSAALQGRLAYARSWYAVKGSNNNWLFGPSKFIGYSGLTAESYIETAEDRDGRRTEAELQQWFVPVDPESELGGELRQALYRYLAQYGKTPSTKARINVRIAAPDSTRNADNDDPHYVLMNTIIAAARTLPPALFARLRTELFGN